MDILKSQLYTELEALRSQGLFKNERLISSAQGAEIRVGAQEVLNFCSNNYLGLSNHPKVVAAAISTMHRYGYGLSSVRFICGTLDIHRELEEKMSAFLGMEDTLLYAAAFDANGGVFEPLFNEQDAIISDALNHASIIDGVRLCKAERHRFTHNNMEALEQKLKATRDKRHRLIVTDGVFSMDGTIAQLDKICALAEQYQAMVMVDDSHATGFVGKTGRGTHEHHQVMDKVDLITGTFGKALGGASGGFTSGKKEVIAMLRQRSRPYLFSNTLAPAITGASIAVLDILRSSSQLRDKVWNNAAYFRKQMTAAGFKITPGEHPIVPVMLFDAALAQHFAAQMMDEHVFVTGFAYPVVPQDQARIRVQLSAAHEKAHIDHVVNAFIKVGNRTGIIPSTLHT